MDPELRTKIIKDLEKSGLGSELHALKVFQELGWSTQASDGYFDADEGKTREIDISAYVFENLEYDGKIRSYTFLHIAAEVKKSERPWIVFKAKDIPFLHHCAWNNIIAAKNLPVSGSELTPYLSKKSPMTRVDWIGSGIHEAFKDPNSPSRWYSAFVTACKAAEDAYRHEDIEEDGDDRITDNIINNPTQFSLFQPLIILDGPLISAELRSDGEIDLNEIDFAPFRFDFNTREYKRGNYRVDLVTLSGLKNYLEHSKERLFSINAGIMKYAPYAFSEHT